jgi:hypothetical protein
MLYIFLTFVVAYFIGYFYGHSVKPNQLLQSEIKAIREKSIALLEEGNKGVYKTIVTDNHKSSELVVEIKELAITKGGQVKVQYLSAFYKNPDFRTSKGDALLNEVRGLLGDYLPMHEIEWYENTEQHARIQNFLNTLDKSYKKQLG